MTSNERLFWDSDSRQSHGSEAQQSTNSSPFLGIGLVPGWRPKQCWIYKDERTCILSSDRQDVVFVEAGRFNRSTEFVTSSELLCLLNLLYNVLSECCDEYINLYNFTEEFRMVFRFLAYIYLWAKFLNYLGFPGALVTLYISLYALHYIWQQ